MNEYVSVTTSKASGRKRTCRTISLMTWLNARRSDGIDKIANGEYKLPNGSVVKWFQCADNLETYEFRIYFDVR